MVKKTIILLIISMFLLSGLASADFEFTEEDKNLGFLDSLRLLFSTQKLFTAAGEQRQCSVNPDETGYIASNQIPFTISCSGQVALINLYNINSNGGWDYFVEVEAPYTITFQPSYLTRAYECYYCPEIVNSCSSGEERCVTENTNQVCQNGQWSSTRTCPSGQKCGLSGSCENVEVIDPLWNCADWGECINNVQERHCWDARNTGKLDNKPPTSRACTTPLSTTTTTLCDKTAIYPEEGRICCQNFLGGYGSKIGGSCYLTKEVPIDECRQAICENKAVVIAGSGPGDTTTTTLGPSADCKLKSSNGKECCKVIGDPVINDECLNAFGDERVPVIECGLIDSCGNGGDPISNENVCNLPINSKCTPPGGPGPDDSGASNECKSGWCKDALGFGGRCSEVGVLSDGSKLSGAEPHPDCVALGTAKKPFNFQEEFTREYFGIPLYVILVVLLLLVMMLGRAGGKK